MPWSWPGRKARETADRGSAIDYLLMSNLNLLARMEHGQPGNERLTILLWDLLERLSPTVFCDIGAFDGSACIAARRKFPDLLVYAFEANPEIFQLHASSPALAGIKYLNLAISDTVGPARIFAPRTLARYYADGRVLPGRVEEPRTTGKSSLLLRDEDATYAEWDVAGTTLDAFFAAEPINAAGQRFVLWIDAEGAADKVLQGAGGILANTVAVLIETESFEFWKAQKDSAHVTRELIRKGFIPIARDREYGDHQFNVLFVKAALVAGIARELFDAHSPLRSCMASPEDQRVPNRAPGIATGARSSIGAHFQSSIPIVIPTFNSVTYLQAMLSQLRHRGFQNIVVVDNASTFPPFLDYVSGIAPEVAVIRLSENRGPRDVFLDKKNLFALPQYFCVTDPDLEFNPSLPEDFLCELAVLTEEHRVGKAGFALDLSDRLLMREDEFQIGAAKYRIWEWEAQFWEHQVGSTSTGDEVYLAAIDTTFAVYNKRYFDPADHLKAVRVAGKYTCRHLPWYRNTGLSREEEDFYRANEQFSFYLKDGDPAGSIGQ
jgi:FkbM family methyltransferase